LLFTPGKAARWLGGALVQDRKGLEKPNLIRLDRTRVAAQESA
jgi:hypothetical protein